MVAGSTQPASPIRDLTCPESVEFKTRHSQTVTTHEVLPKAVYLELGEAWPRALPYRELRERACRRAGIEGTLDLVTEAKLIRMLVSSLANALVEFHVYQPQFCRDLSKHPVASIVARWEAEAGKPVTSLLLSVAAMQEPDLRKLLPFLDGTRDPEALLGELRRSDPGITAETLRNSLQRLAQYGMLLA